MTRNLVLFGMMGAGKSTVARLVAARLGRAMVETDAHVERAAGRPIAEIFATAGEAAFRRLERDAVAGAARRTDQVVSVGGGAVLDDTNVATLRATGVLVLLDTPPDTLTARLIRDADHRPLLHTPDLAGRVAELAAARGPRYAHVADHVVDATAAPADVAAAVVAWAADQPDVLADHERAKATP
ncbi:MAG: shikimate kinase [Actinobacteria bacterium]|nr:shikimate kinase [Actinomycetota bacterium]